MKPTNIFKINDPEFVLLNHIIQQVHVDKQLIGIEPYYQHGTPGLPLFGPPDPQFIYLALQFTCFRNDQVIQMVYNVEDDAGDSFAVVADSIFSLGPGSLFTARMEQKNFLLRRFSVVANIVYWEFVGWRLTLKT